MFPVLYNFSETPCMKVSLDVRISLVRVLSTGGRGSFPSNVSFPPPKKKSFPEKKIKSYFKY